MMLLLPTLNPPPSLPPQIMAMGSPDPVALLSEALQPPSPQSVASTVEALAALSAIEPDPSRQKLPFKYRLTPLGSHMSRLPCDVRIAKLLLLATTFRCIRPVLDIAACLSHRSPFSAPFDLMQQLNAARDSFALPAGARPLFPPHQRHNHITPPPPSLLSRRGQ